SSRPPCAILLWLEALEGPADTSIQNNSGPPQGPASASTATSACGKLAQRVPEAHGPRDKAPIDHAARRRGGLAARGAGAAGERMRRIGVLMSAAATDTEGQARIATFRRAGSDSIL